MRAAAIIAIAVSAALVSPADANKKPWLGVYVASTPSGVRIDRVVPNTPADRAKLTPGDVVVSVSGVAVRQAGELIREITTNHKIGDVAALHVLRNGQRIEVDVTLDSRLSASEMFAQAQVGQQAPDAWRPLTPVSGKRRLSSKLSDHRGDVVVVYLFASGCKQCAPITRTLEQLDAALGKRGLVVLAVGEESVAGLSRLRTRLPVFADAQGVMRRSFSARDHGTLPLVAVVGRDGVVTHAALGQGVDVKELRAAIERAVRATTAQL